jgi:glycosyltransferase involved in cell wall biosynthesis
MKIAIMGIRGIPANYGGYETFIEEMAPRLADRGHDVTVYGRSHFIQYPQEYYKNVRIKLLPTIGHKYFDTVFHTLMCVLYSFFSHYDVVFMCNSANAIMSFIPRLYGKPTVLNVDGLEWKRKKWNWAGKAFYRISEFLATFLPNAIVSDARDVQRYYLKKFGKESHYIPYGAPAKPLESQDILKKYGLKPRDYILYVSRMEPENNAHRVVSAFEKVKTRKKLVMVGDAPYSPEYIRNVRKTTDPRIIFTGYIFGQGYREMQSHAYFYIQATEVGGTHPALLEGMGYGNCILANQVPEHEEVLADTGVYFSLRNDSDLTVKMQALCDSPALVAAYRRRVQERVHGRYTWDGVTADYERLFKSLLARRNK